MFEHRSRMFDRDTREFFSDTNCSMIIDPIKKQEFQESVEYIHTYIRIYTRGEKRILFNNYSGDRSIRIVWFSLSGNEAIFHTVRRRSYKRRLYKTNDDGARNENTR